MEHPLSLKPPRAAHPGPTVRLHARGWHSCQTDSFIAAWDALATGAAQPNPFYESWYLAPSLAALDPGGTVQLMVLEADGQLVGLLPIRRERRYYGHPVPHWRGWVHGNCFLGLPLVVAGFERVFWHEALAWCDRQGGSALFLHLLQQPTDGPLHQALQAELAAQARAAATVLTQERALLASTLTPEDYFATSLSAKKRKELRRQQRRLEEHGQLEIERRQDAAGAEAWAAEFLTLERRGWKGQAESALACDPATAQLFTQALAGAAQRGRLDRLALRLDGQPIAMLASFLSPPGAFSYKTAFDEDFARFSPGVLLQRENLALLERSDIAFVDSCADADHPMIDHFWRERRTIARHSIAIGGRVRRGLFSILSRCETGAFPGAIA